MRYREPYTFFKRKMKNGKVIYYYRTYDENGRRLAFSTGQTTKSKALEYVLELVKKDQLIPDKKEKNITFREFTEDFFVWDKCEYIIERNTLGGKSISKEHAYTERGFIKNWIRPYFNPRILKTITSKDIKDYIIKLKKDGKITDGSIKHILKIIKIIFAEAERRELIVKNPAREIPYPKVEQKERGILTRDEAQRLFNESRMMDIWGSDMAYTLNLFAIMTGCRRGEILGLQNKYVHKEYVEIKQAWGKLSGLKPTKTKESRVIPIGNGNMKSP